MWHAAQEFVTHPGSLLAVFGVAFAFASVMMKSMIPLRALALVGNAFFVAYGFVEAILPPLVLNLLLLPVNARRLWEISKLSKEIERATRDTPLSQWLLPHMRPRSFKAGDVLLKRGETADELIYVASGQLKVEEIGGAVGPGELVGEIGLVSRDKMRTQTLIAETAGEAYYMTEEMFFQLYYKNPKLGFYVMRLVVQRLFSDLERQRV
jgi:hypothetical protein